MRSSVSGWAPLSVYRSCGESAWRLVRQVNYSKNRLNALQQTRPPRSGGTVAPRGPDRYIASLEPMNTTIHDSEALRSRRGWLSPLNQVSPPPGGSLIHLQPRTSMRHSGSTFTVTIRVRSTYPRWSGREPGPSPLGFPHFIAPNLCRDGLATYTVTWQT